jgi:opacity protein-like surface antigen
MKTKFVFLLLVASPMMSAQALAAGIGLYISPKLMYENTKTHYRTNDDFQRYGRPPDDARQVNNISFSDSALGYGLAVGFDFSKKFSNFVSPRFELEYVKSSEKSDKGILMFANRSYLRAKAKFSSSIFFINGYADFHNSTLLTPYVSLGLGFAKSDVKVVRDSFLTGHSWGTEKESATRFAYNYGIGSAFRITDTVGFDLGYRYANLGKVNHGTLKSHQFLLGARFNF